MARGLCLAFVASTALLVGCGGKVTESNPDGGPAGTDTGGRAIDVSFVEHICDVFDGHHCGSFDLAKCKRQAPCVLDTYSHAGLLAVASCADTATCSTDIPACFNVEAAKIPRTAAVAAFEDACAAAASRCGHTVGVGYCPGPSGSALSPALFRDELLVKMTACFSSSSCGGDVDGCVYGAVNGALAACP